MCPLKRSPNYGVARKAEILGTVADAFDTIISSGRRYGSLLKRDLIYKLASSQISSTALLEEPPPEVEKAFHHYLLKWWRHGERACTELRDTPLHSKMPVHDPENSYIPSITWGQYSQTLPREMLVVYCS